jgi:hypothetical protein
VAVVDSIPVARISAEARQIHFGEILLALIGAVFYGLGWSVSKALLAVAWCLAAVKLGWADARRPVTHEVP